MTSKTNLWRVSLLQLMKKMIQFMQKEGKNIDNMIKYPTKNFWCFRL